MPYELRSRALSKPPTRDQDYPKSFDAYHIEKKLGEGSFAEVQLAYPKKQRNKKVALKIVKLGDFEDDKWKRLAITEVELINKVHHPNILQCFTSFQDMDGARLVMVLEYADLGDLEGYINEAYFVRNIHLPERRIWRFFTQIAAAISFMHGKRLLHRDLKPANVMMMKEGLKVCDFGLSRLMSLKTKILRTNVGTPYYMSPERTCGEGYSLASDVWSLGCILYELAAGGSPFIGERSNEFALQMRVKTGEYPPIPEDVYTDELNFLVKACLRLDMGERPTSAQVHEYSAKMDGFYRTHN